MFSFRVRPKISCVTPMTQSEIYARFDTFLKETKKPLRGKKYRDHIQLQVAAEEEHYWSPILNIIFKDADNGTTVQGRFGPHPKVWTMFMFFYFFGIALCFFAAIFGGIQLQLGRNPWALWMLAAGLVLLILIYVAAQIGQRKGHAQTEWLLSFCSEVLKHEGL